MPVLCLKPRGWGGLSWNMTNISFVLGLVGLSLNYLTWGSKCYIQHLVMPAFQVTFLKCTERLIFFLPVTRTVLPFDAHDLLLNLICSVSFCFLLLVLPGASVPSSNMTLAGHSHSSHMSEICLNTYCPGSSSQVVPQPFWVAYGEDYLPPPPTTSNLKLSLCPAKNLAIKLRAPCRHSEVNPLSYLFPIMTLLLPEHQHLWMLHSFSSPSSSPSHWNNTT